MFPPLQPADRVRGLRSFRPFRRRVPMYRALALAALILPAAAPADAPKKAEAGKKAAGKKEPWTVDDVLLAETATHFRLSPDGRWAVWVKSAMNKEKGEAVSNLVRTDLRSATDVELTRGDVSC